MRVILALCLLVLPAQAAEFEFCWEGANGYRMEGRMTVPDALLGEPLITHNDVTDFFYSGLPR